MKGGASYSSPAITSDLLYMGDWANNIYCLNITTGAEIWAYTTGAHVNSSPAIVGGSVFVASWDHRVYAFGTSSTVTEPFSINSEYLLILGVIAAIVVVMIVIFIARKRASKQKSKTSA
jgi:outer membrane protein assembly factor BamB